MENAFHKCRICFAEGARNIFLPNMVDDERCTVASINRLAEKLRYVIKLPISEHDGLSHWICELCIVQLNLAYNFKRLAIESVKEWRAISGVNQPNFHEIDIAIANGTEGDGSLVDISSRVKLERTDMDPLRSCSDRSTPYTECSDYYASVRSSADVNRRLEADRFTSQVNANRKEVHNMVTLNMDLTNPDEDKAFIRRVIRKSCLPQVIHSLSPSKTFASARKPLSASNGARNTHHKISKPCAEDAPLYNHQRTSRKPEVSTAKCRKRNRQSDTGTKKIKRKISRQEKLASVYKELEINMVPQHVTPKVRFLETPLVRRNPNLSIAEKVKLRRNSVCVSSNFSFDV